MKKLLIFTAVSSLLFISLTNGGLKFPQNSPSDVVSHDFCREISIIGNLFAHNAMRNPYFKAHTTGVKANNIIYNPGRIIDTQDDVRSYPKQQAAYHKLHIPKQDITRHKGLAVLPIHDT